MSDLRIIEVGPDAFERIWPFFRPIVTAGESYPYPPESSFEEGRQYWFPGGGHTYIAEDAEGRAVGSYYIKPNQPGLGAHVCNAGFMVDPDFEGRGVGEAMARDSLVQAYRLGFVAMQFNLVVATNVRAIDLWERLGFETVGRLAGAFRHPKTGEVDALVMYKRL